MPQVSQRGNEMPASPIRRLVPLANKAIERGLKVYRLNIGQPDVPTPPGALEALKHIDRKVLEYSPSEGLKSLREKLRQYYKRFHIDVDVDDIIITTGGSEAVLFAFMACLDPGDEIIVPEPAYANYMAFAISAGAKIVTIPSSIDDGFELPPVEKFEELITPRTKGILICNPNNPTGYLYTMKEMLQIRDLVLKHDLFLFSDEVYREFCYTGAPYISAFHLPGSILFLEDVSEPVYKIERIFYQLRLSGLFDKIAGLIVGQFTDYKPDSNHESMESMIRDAIAGYKFPVAFNVPVGHVDHNVPLIESAKVTLKVSPSGRNSIIFHR